MFLCLLVKQNVTGVAEAGGGGDYGPPYLEDIEKRTEILSGAK